MPQPHHTSDGRDDSGWMRHAVVGVVSHYCQPHESVLVVTAQTDEPREDQGLALNAVAESASGLSRTLEVRTVLPTEPFPLPHRGVGSASKSRSGPLQKPLGPRSVWQRTDTDRPDSSETDPRCFDIVIACVDARSTDWVERVPWDALVGPAGLLAFLVHSPEASGDATAFRGLLYPVARRAGLILLDQIILCTLPVHTRVLLFMRPLPAVRHPDC